jgi:aerobic-type carbon monoxide dehydrogenase small subunit (CoxS/CutS family)
MTSDGETNGRRDDDPGVSAPGAPVPGHDGAWHGVPQGGEYEPEAAGHYAFPDLAAGEQPPSGWGYGGETAYGGAGAAPGPYDASSGYGGAPYDQSGFDQTSFDQPSFDQAPFDQPSFGQSSFEQQPPFDQRPSFDQAPSFDQSGSFDPSSTFEQNSSFEQPAAFDQQSAFDQGAFQPPAFDTSSLDRPLFRDEVTPEGAPGTFQDGGYGAGAAAPYPEQRQPSAQGRPSDGQVPFEEGPGPGAYEPESGPEAPRQDVPMRGGALPPEPTGLAGEPPAPLGGPAGPLGEPAGPLGEPAGPLGEALPPLGEPSLPTGEPPLGEPSLPTGEPPLGEPSLPTGEPPLGEPPLPPMSEPPVVAEPAPAPEAPRAAVPPFTAAPAAPMGVPTADVPRPAPQAAFPTGGFAPPPGQGGPGGDVDDGEETGSFAFWSPGALEAAGQSRAEADAAPEAGVQPEAVQGDAPGLEHPLVSYVLRVNGADRPVTDAWLGESLLYVLRERLGLAGAKDGCEQGECGACSVQVDGRLVASCLVPAATAAGCEVRTVEGLGDGEPSDVQRAIARSGAVQCGYCVPGLAMAVSDLLAGNHNPTELQTRQALSGNLCRCSGYRGVLAAVREVVAGREAAAEAAKSEEPVHIPQQAGPESHNSANGWNPGGHS